MFVMGKEQGWGDKQPENLKNGDWALYCLRCFQQAADGGFHKVPRLPHAAGAERFRPPLRRIFPNESADVVHTSTGAAFPQLSLLLRTCLLTRQLFLFRLSKYVCVSCI